MSVRLYATEEIQFPIKDFFRKFNQKQTADLLKFTSEILNFKLLFSAQCLFLVSTLLTDYAGNENNLVIRSNG